MPAEVHRGGGMAKLNWVLDLTDPSHFVQELETGELYRLIGDIGRASSAQLLELANDDQLAEIQILDLWNKDEVRLDRWFGWLDLARTLNVDTSIRVAKATQPELLEWIFTRHVRVHGRELDTAEVPDELALYDTPDGAFYVTVPRDDELADRLPGLMKLLWAADMDRMFRIFHSARFSLPSVLEESLRTLRAGQLADMGFVGPHDALEVYAIVDLNEVKALLDEPVQAGVQTERYGRQAQDLSLRDVFAPRLLSDSLEALTDSHRREYLSAFATLVNKVFMAQTGDLSHTDRLSVAGRHTAGVVNLALGYLSAESPGRAVSVLERLWPERLFRVGVTLLHQLRLRAAQVGRRAGVDQGLNLMGSHADEVLQGAIRQRPSYYEGLDGRGALTWRDFESMDDLARIEVVLSDIDEVLSFFETRFGFSPEALLTQALSGMSAEDRRQVRLQTLFRTGLVQAVLSEEFSFQPLSREDLAAFLALAFELKDGEVLLSAPLTTSMDSIAKEVSPGVSRWTMDAMDEMRRALGKVQVHELDPAFASELVLVAS